MARKSVTLVRAVLGLVNATNAASPLLRAGNPGIVTFAYGWPSGEAAGVLLGSSVLSAVRRGRRGDFSGTSGRIALVITAITWAILGFIFNRSLRSRPAFEQPLHDLIGPDSAADSTGPRVPGMLRTMVSRRKYNTQTVKYGPHRANLADIWRRPDLPLDGKAPVLLQVPGGGWMLGDRRPQAYPLLSHLAERGWICVSIGYRVSPKHAWPAHIIDVKQALAWIKENIADYGGDPDFVAISGGSAGGHLSSLAALTPGDPQWQPGFEDADTSVVAAVPVYGRYDWFSFDGPGRPEMMQALEQMIVKKPFSTDAQEFLDASPITRIRPDAPPFFVLHGTDDTMIAVQEGRDFVAALREESLGPVAYAEIPNAQHAFDVLGSAHGRYTAEAITRFLEWVRAEKAKALAPADEVG
ncbi:alpha/beta hydrolase [Mycobacterium sp. CBMA293]|uniref:alpha/beta hydrolase n=1 Tax=unclassified Mycolicibacterium TaxID=2636767 RepID=UPI0012DEC2FE|nr:MULTISPECIES: alpha/beta hydrolase [unclassified Mycolicibacterium]MUL47384.1 alpha/beta hydrolase [Mycolicibacterium sp. CBMA 360]MUL59369.1 alpha/beta hydrolase [Mycolicibacterium sp. CBMA 335]MUL71094.1 alpha/beta hydrolase [Mycolicibacterium sp. CBMA 311]MUL94737.1 alpha/beta hydrolase [Mycolicibacterium sp. CBMA 230]MUM09083.1 esterase [Mycolicibacterium sp. CBMA 213]